MAFLLSILGTLVCVGVLTALAIAHSSADHRKIRERKAAAVFKAGRFKQPEESTWKNL